MSSFDLPIEQPMIVTSEWGEQDGMLLDQHTDTWVVRADRMPEDWPGEVELSFGHANFFWRVKTAVKATYAPWAFIERPDETLAEKIQRRGFVRIAFETQCVGIPTQSGALAAGEPTTLALQNLSANGCLATTEPGLLEPGDRLILALALPHLPVMPTMSQVVRVAERGGQAHVGLHFPSLTGAPQEQLVRFVTGQIQSSLQHGLDIVLPDPRRVSDEHALRL